MGGSGSGRPGYRPKVEQMKRLDLARLRRKGYLSGFPVSLSWSMAETPLAASACKRKFDGVRLFYRARTDDGEWYDVDELIPTVWTPTQFGGRRQWFCCLKCARAMPHPLRGQPVSVPALLSPQLQLTSRDACRSRHPRHVQDRQTPRS